MYTGYNQRAGKKEETKVVDFMARPEGVEPPTLGSEVQCSIH
jgi:hypothetical protein